MTLADLDPKYPVRFAFAGAKHLIVVLKARAKLAAISYHFARVKTLMEREELVTIDMVWVESHQRFHARNFFPQAVYMKTPQQVPPLPLSRVICVTLSGKVEIVLRFYKEKRWVAPLDSLCSTQRIKAKVSG
ncbi:MAG: PhzF family phenazine biosynthesis protein [Caldilineaceae bacterium]